ncbi:MAG: glycosyltransferase family 25 protein [Proteobacteria bacterium]|nr:glycosyltransferase family 25 protein [Pseudomonadota bacterium]HQR04149.1 glycosyltransferase family 25 protein [Rhodocyclaceae bacterium]
MLVDIVAFVINLAAASGRRRLMEAQLSLPGLPAFEIVSGVDGRALSGPEMDAVYDVRLASRKLTMGEIGCALGHCAVFERIVARDVPVALVLEDDALIGHKLPSLLEKLRPQMDPARPQIVLLSHVERYSAWGMRRAGRKHRLARPYEAAGGHAYLLTRAAAAALLAAQRPVRNPPDAWCAFMDQGIVDVRCVVPYAVGTAPAANASQIGDERLAYTDGTGIGPWLRKYLYQKLLFQILVKPVLRLKRQVSSW